MVCLSDVSGTLQGNGAKGMQRMSCCTCKAPIFKGEKYSITPGGKRRHKKCLRAHMEQFCNEKANRSAGCETQTKQ
jgi:hypothetical protein